MNNIKAMLAVSIAIAGLTTSSLAQPELLRDPDFSGTLDGSNPAWGTFGAAGINDFFNGNAHGSLFSDNPGNFGGIFDAGIAGVAGATYTFTLTDVRIEENFDADLRFGLEFYQTDNSTPSGPFSLSIISDSSSTAQTGDGLMFTMTATAPAGTEWVRPIVQFDNVRSTAGGQENVFVFDARLVPTPGTAGVGLLAAGALARRRR
ncbi:MAG: hypothetical protein AAF747_00115 [Planctomycetota bacterium]